MIVPDPRLEVVVITRDRVEELLGTLARLAALPERPPVTVVDNGSVDGTAARVSAEFPAVRLIRLDRNLGAVGRNVGVAHASTPYVAFCDDDTWWEPGGLRRAADLLDAYPSLAVVTARIVVEPSGRDDPICADMEFSPLPARPDLPGRPLGSFLAGASVVRRRAFTEAGGFNEDIYLGNVGGEEELLATDMAVAGWELVYVPEIVVHHCPSRARDPHTRRRVGIRNALWVTWLRRPVRPAVRRTGRMLRRLPRDRITAAALVDALGGVPFVLRNRHVVPAHVERRLAALDAQQLSSRARRYVS